MIDKYILSIYLAHYIQILYIYMLYNIYAIQYVIIKRLYLYHILSTPIVAKKLSKGFVFVILCKCSIEFQN